MSGANNVMWEPPPRPDWLDTVNREGEYLEMRSVVPLDESSLISHAQKLTGLEDFGGDAWREPFAVYLRALEEEAQLTLMGRLMARNDLLQWLSTRLQVTDLLRRHPQIRDEEVSSPMFIVGLPRSGTSILFELLAQDAAVGVPLMWEALQPCPPPETESYHSDARIARAHALFTQWQRVAPEFAQMHEMRGDLPAECGLLMAPTFVSDHNASLHQTPSYSAWLAQADYRPVYEFHKLMLQILQWKNPRQRWLLKAPEHQVHLETLLQVYPDARIVQTHRDPIKCMASATSLMGTLYYMRSDQPFNAAMFENIIMGQATAARLETVIDQRAAGIVPEKNIFDSRYCDLMQRPMDCIEAIYRHFDMTFTEQMRSAVVSYLQEKPQGKFGAHQYEVNAARESERALFERYQAFYNVPDEV